MIIRDGRIFDDEIGPLDIGFVFTSGGKASTGKVSTYTAQDVASWSTSLPGQHNRENIAAVWAVAKTLGINEEQVKQVVQDFHGLPHRLETMREVDGVKYINDTTATTPTAAVYALRAMTAPTIWITGGDTKNLPFEVLLDEVAKNNLLNHIIILGSNNIPDYVTALEGVAKSKIAGKVGSMEEAVKLARTLSQSGDTVLLSPGFASFDLFQNEFDRGRQFNDAVGSL